MQEQDKRAFFINALLIAYADGEVHPHELQWIEALIRVAGISAEQEQAWHQEIKSGNLEFQPVGHDRAVDMIKLAAGVMGADNRLDQRERHALLQLGNLLGLAPAELNDIFRASWGKNVLAEIFPPLTDAPDSDSIVLLRDYFERLEEIVSANATLELTQRSWEEFRRHPGQPAFVVFHTAPDRKESEGMLSDLKSLAARAKLVAVVQRHQAVQVSYMLAGGAFRCMIAEGYPQELSRIVQLGMNG